MFRYQGVCCFNHLHSHSYLRGKWSSAIFPLRRSLVNTQKWSWSYCHVNVHVVSSTNLPMLEISTFKASCVQMHKQKCGLFDEASHCRKAINTRMQEIQFPRRSFYSGALDSHQYGPLALRADRLQLRNSFRTNFKQKGSHTETKSHKKRFFRFWEYWIMPATEGVGLHVYCFGGNSVPFYPP